MMGEIRLMEYPTLPRQHDKAGCFLFEFSQYQEVVCKYAQ
jgi:hypothetical protein